MSFKDLVFSGGKGGGGSFKNRPDNLRSTDSFEALLGLASNRASLAPGGLKNLFVNDIAVEDENGHSMLEDFTAIVFDGDPTQLQPIKLTLGSSAGPSNLNLTLTNPPENQNMPGPWVNGFVEQQNVDFIDLRFVVNALYRQDKKGVYDATANIEIALRPSGTSTWINPLVGTAAPGYDPNGFSSAKEAIQIIAQRARWDEAGTSWADTGSNLTISGKTTSPYVKEMRIAVPNTGAYANKTWEVRCRLLERDYYVGGEDNLDEEHRDVVWESIAGVSTAPIGGTEGWRGVAYVQIVGKASDQINGIPNIQGIYDIGRYAVPPMAVFNPADQTFTGQAWDGATTQIAWTQCPAWQIKGLIEDDLSGVSALVPGSTLNKWDALEASKWFAQRVPDGRGGTQPRYTLNWISEQPQNVNDLVNYLAGAVGAFCWDEGDGRWRMKVEQPEQPQMIFTKENIIGEFVYSHTDWDSRFNDITGVYRDRDNRYKENRVRTFDQPSIDQTGRRATQLVLVGCDNRQEALRRIELRKLTALNETRIVTFTTNRQGGLLEPFSVIGVADGDLNSSQSIRSTGRIVQMAGDRKSFAVRDVLRLEVGVAYTVEITIPNPDYNPEIATDPSGTEWRKPTITITRTITNTAAQRGDIYQLFLDDALPASVPDFAPIALSAVGLPALPKQYRVLAVVPDDEGENFSITATEIYTAKWVESDNVVEDEILAQAASKIVPPAMTPPGGMFVEKSFKTDFAQRRVLSVNWTRPILSMLDGYRVEMNQNGGPWQDLGLTKDTYYELADPIVGSYKFRVFVRDRKGRESEPLVGSYEVSDAQLVTWGGVADDGNRPEDNATVGGKVGNGTLPGNITDTAGNPLDEDDLVTSKGTSKDTQAVNGVPATSITANIDQILVRQDDLEEIYGDTVSAAASAANAATSATAAQGYRDAANTAAGNAATANTNAQSAMTAAQGFSSAASTSAGAADTAKTGAQTAKTAAETARDQANTALTNATTQATNASNSATAASNSATAANTSAGNAATSASAASTSASGAATSATNAGTSASAAATSATNANTYAGQAQTSATNAATSATNASGSATSASTSATTASNASNAAQIAAAAKLPSDFSQDGTYWAGSYTSQYPSALAAGGNYSFVTVAGVGRVIQIASNSPMWPRGYLNLVANRRYRWTVKYRAVTDPSTGAMTVNRAMSYSLNTDFTFNGGGVTLNTGTTNKAVTVAMGWQTDVVEFTTSATPPPFWRGMIQAGFTGALDGAFQVATYLIEDITSENAAAGSASAAATSATNAATSATTAGQQASAASTSATNAATSASNANTYATNASNSATNAAGSASTASTQAGVATTAATNAGTSATNASNSATAASTSASNAASSATTAGQQATAAQNSATAANTSAGNASTSASQASTSATNAGNSATAAAGSATAASTSAGNASTSAGQASTSATNAAGSASAAASSATVASNSAADAATSLASTFPQTVSAAIFTQGFNSFADGSIPSNTMSADGKTIQLDTAVATYAFGVWPNSKIVWAPGRKYQLTAVIKKVSGADPNYTGCYVTFWNAAKSNYANQVVSPYVLMDGTVQTVTWTFDTATGGAAGDSFRIGITTNRQSAGANLTTPARVDVTALYIRDVTEQSNAAGSATAAATSASNAATQATNASNSASAAQTSATNASTSAGQANTYAGNASTSATNAATSASNAAGSANTASTQATNASNSASAAAGSATAASGSASTASTQATNASNSASAAAASQVSASSSAASALQSAAATFPSDFTQEGKFWQAGYIGDPATRTSLVTGATYRFPNVANVGKVFEVDGGGATYYSPIGVMKAQAGRRYRCTMTARITNVPTSSPQFLDYITYLSDTYAQVTNISTASGVLIQNTWVTKVTEVSGDTVIAAGGTYIRPIFAALTAGNTYQLASCKFEDITDQYNAAGSATAAATSASNASTSATNAGNSASAASTSATAANTSAGNASSSASTATTQASNASTSATNAANSATAAAGSATTASTQAGNASTSATNAQSYASASSASAAAALASATVAASVANNSLVKNPVFSDYTSTTYPANWSSNVGTATRVTGQISPFAMQLSGPANANCIAVQTVGSGTDRRITVNQWLVIESDITLVSGTLTSGGVLFRAFNSTGASSQDLYLTFSTDPSSSGAVLGAGTAGQRYTFAKLVRTTLADAAYFQLFAMAHWDGMGSNATANSINFHRVSVRSATDQEIASNTATANLGLLTARVATNEGAIATIDGKTQAYSQKEVVAGAAAAFISFRAKDDNGALTSDVAIGASNISLYNQTTAGWTLALQMVGGNAVFTGGLQAGAFIRLGSGAGWPVALKAKDFLVSDGDVVSFGTDLGGLPALDFKTNNLAPLSAGETYKLYAESLSSTGFTARLRILTPASPSSYDLTSATNPGSGPTLQMDKSSSPDATDGNYRLQFSGTITLHSTFIPD